MLPFQIVVVDESAAQLEAYKRILARIPNTLHIGFESTSDALSWCETSEPDLLIVDLSGQSSVCSLIADFRRLPHKSITPVVVLTASKDATVRYNALEAGANDFLMKPADPIEFIARVRNLLALRDAQKKLADRSALLQDEIRKATYELVQRERETIFQLIRISEFRDDDTAAHIIRIGHLAALLAETLGLRKDQVDSLRVAAPMHDVGKVSIPDNVLLKRGKLGPEEWVVMRKHTTAGYELLRQSKSKMLQEGAEIALTHHEKFNGAGYPNGLKGDEIPLGGRITALVDVYDALTSERPYKMAWPPSKALDLLQRERGSHFDPQMVDAFFSVLPQVNEIKVRYADGQATVPTINGRAESILPQPV